jgi:hypothetical protein
MVKRQDRRHPGPEVIASRPIAVIAKLRHELVPAFRDVSIVDSDLGRTPRWQGGFGLKSATLFAIAGYQNRHIKNEEHKAATH